MPPHPVAYVINSVLAIFYALLRIHCAKILEFKMTTFISKETDLLKIMGVGFQIAASLVF